MTPKQIEEELETLASYYGNDFNDNETKEHNPQWYISLSTVESFGRAL